MKSILTALFYYYATVGIILLFIAILYPITKEFVCSFMIGFGTILFFVERIEFKKGTRNNKKF